ncbi:MAG TPA: alpha/beta fold hydrolase [Longimicrobiales bacterium]|nr:alpha/beta fold hydrolase [Longimicrobiales bacterium]
MKRLSVTMDDLDGRPDAASACPEHPTDSVGNSPPGGMRRGVATRRVVLAAVLASMTAVMACDGGHAVLRDAPGDTLVAVNGTRLWVHVEEEGVEGERGRVGSEVIVVVHGGPLLDHGYLVEPLRPLATFAPLVFYDQRLSGRSDGVADPPAPDVSLATFVEDIEGLREALDLDRIHLLGHSWGGGLTMRYAIAHPDRVRSLILVSPPAPSFDLAAREARARMEALEPADTVGMGALRASDGLAGGDPEVIARLLRMSFRSQMLDRASADQLEFHVPDDYLARSEALQVLGPELSGADLTSELRGLGVPTLVVYGAEEVGARLTGPAYASLLPDVRVETIEGAKHFAFMEAPLAFRSLVREFLSGI